MQLQNHDLPRSCDQLRPAATEYQTCARIRTESLSQEAGENHWAMLKKLSDQSIEQRGSPIQDESESLRSSPVSCSGSTTQTQLPANMRSVECGEKCLPIAGVVGLS